MKRLIAILVLLGPAAGADDNPDRVAMKLNHVSLTWTARQGLAVFYDGTPVFVPDPQEITVHTVDWQKALYRGNEGTPVAKFARKGDQQILTVRLPANGFKATETITAGPGDRFRVEWKYSQNGWDDAALQLGFSRPSMGFWVGSSFRGKSGDQTIAGVIPLQPPDTTSHPFANATELTVSSLFGTLSLKSSKPVTIYDYAKRESTFFLGFDEPLPRGKDLAFTIDVVMKPAEVEREGLAVSDFRISNKVDDGVLKGGLRVTRKTGSVERVRLSLVGTGADGKSFEVGKETEVTGKPTAIDLTKRILEPGALRCAMVLATVPEGKEVLRTPEFTVQVLPLMTVLPNLSLYTSEERGAFLVRTSTGLKGRDVTFAAEGSGVKTQATVRPGERASVPFETRTLANGATEATCRLLEGNADLAIAKVVLRKAPPKPNDVKIDYASRGLIVDGLPYLPFGFYCIFPPGNLPTEEAPQGFTHIAPYQESDADPVKVKEYMDRCAAVGMKVHYDIRAVAQSEPSAEKWRRLKAMVEAVRDHPALLCWYLCDEPDGQGIPPARLEESYKFVKDLDPYHPITMVFCVPPKAPDYVKGMDLMMADPYPIPHAPVTNVSDVTDGLNRAVDYGMPLWIVPQAFGGGEWWKREPSAQEERVMTYLSLIHGATGIQYFVRRAPIGNPISPSLWSECRRLALEGAELAPALLSSEPGPTVKSNSPAVHVAVWRHRGDLLVLAANTENRPVPVQIQLGEKLSEKATVLFANRTILVKVGVIDDMIEGFGTRAYRVPSGEQQPPRATVNPANLTVNPSFEEFANTGTPDGCYVGVGKDIGASLFIDSRLSVHGGHSLRVCTPAEDQGVGIIPFPIQVSTGKRYRLSLWARGMQQEGLRFRFGAGMLDCGVKEFTATREWAEYSVEGTANGNHRQSLLLSLVSKGTMWFDLIQMVEVR